MFIGKNIGKNIIFTKQVRLIDVLPSLCYLSKLDFDYTSIDGQNLFPIKSENIFEELPAYIESNPMIDMKSDDVIGIRTSKFKYFRDKDVKTKRVHLFNLQTDPNEEDNIAQSHNSIVTEMEGILESLLKTNRKITINENELSSSEIENELKKMGYI